MCRVVTVQFTVAQRDEEEKRREALNVDVTKKADLTGFYSHMLDELAGKPSMAPAVSTENPTKLPVAPAAATTPAESSLPPTVLSAVKASAAVTEAISDAQPSTSTSTDSTPASAAPVPAAAPALSKAELIAAAKERALSRKRARDTGAPEPGDA